MGNLKLVQKENNTFYFEEKINQQSLNNKAFSKKIDSETTNNSKNMKETLAFEKSATSFADRNLNKVNNRSIDESYYRTNNPEIKNFNKMKFQHFNYEAGRSYYV